MTLNNQMGGFWLCGVFVDALRAAVLTSKVVALIDALADYAPVFAAKTWLVIAETVLIGRVGLARHVLGVVQFKATATAILLAGLGTARKIIFAIGAYSDFVRRRVASGYQSSLYCFSLAGVGAKAVGGVVGLKDRRAYLARPRMVNEWLVVLNNLDAYSFKPTLDVVMVAANNRADLAQGQAALGVEAVDLCGFRVHDNHPFYRTFR